MDYTDIRKLEEILQEEIEGRRDTAIKLKKEVEGEHSKRLACLMGWDRIGPDSAHIYKERPYDINTGSPRVEVGNFVYSKPLTTSPLFCRVANEAEGVVKKLGEGTQPLLKVDVIMSHLSDMGNLRPADTRITHALISDLYYKKAVMEDYIVALEKRITALEERLSCASVPANCDKP